MNDVTKNRGLLSPNEGLFFKQLSSYCLPRIEDQHDSNSFMDMNIYVDFISFPPSTM